MKTLELTDAEYEKLRQGFDVYCMLRNGTLNIADKKGTFLPSVSRTFKKRSDANEMNLVSQKLNLPIRMEKPCLDLN